MGDSGWSSWSRAPGQTIDIYVSTPTGDMAPSEGSIRYDVVSWEHIYDLAVKLAAQIDESGAHHDCIVGVSRGGLIPARLLSDLLNLKELYVMGVVYYLEAGRRAGNPVITFPVQGEVRGRRVLLTDDVADSGDSLLVAREHLRQAGASRVLTATLYCKPWSRLKPDFFAETTEAWIVFPWERMEFTLERVQQEGYQVLDSIGYDARVRDALRGLIVHARKKSLNR
jgi:hypoxanthine phosphoribosyltransferase